MLNHPEMGPNATINRWIEQILMFHFKIRHVSGKTFGPDGLSRREKQPSDEEYLVDGDIGDVNKSPELKIADGSVLPLDFDSFKDEIDTRGGYMQSIAESVDCFKLELGKANLSRKIEEKFVLSWIDKNRNHSSDELQFVNHMVNKETNSVDDAYVEDHRTESGKSQDERLPVIREWLTDPLKRPIGYDDGMMRNLIRTVTHFFITPGGKLYEKGLDSAHKLVVSKED